MANRYWVGGTGTWNASDTSVWSATSGGASGASVPTSADSVFFDQAGSYTVTFSGTINCLDFTVSAGPVTFTGTAAPGVYGSFTLLAGTTWSTTGSVTFRSTTTGKTVTTNGTTLTGAAIFNGVGGAWSLGSALTTSSFLTVANGTLSTSASNYATNSNSINVSGGTFTLNGSTVTTPTLNFTSGTINANTSTIILQDPDPLTAFAGTFNAGTSTVSCTSATDFNTGAGATFYNVSFSASTNSVTIGGTNTFSGTLTISSPSSTAVRNILFSSDQTIATFSCSGSSTTRRLYLQSDVMGTARTLTITTWSTVQNIDFSDITLTNAKSGTSLGDRKGNTNITFSTPKTVYLVTMYWDSGWSSSSGGSSSAADFPLAQDTAIIDNNTPSLIIHDAALFAVGTVDLSARSTALQFDMLRSLCVYGNVIGSSSITYNPGSANGYRFFGRTTQTLTSPTAPNITVDSLGGTLRLGSNCTLANTLETRIDAGTLDLNSYFLTTGTFWGAPTANGITFGSSHIIITGTSGTVWYYANATASTFSGTPLVVLTGTSGTRNIQHNTVSTSEAKAVSFTIAAGSSGTVTTTANSGVKNLDFTGFSALFSPGVLTVYGNLLFSNTMSVTGTDRMTFAGTSGTQTINTNGRTVTFPITFNAASGSFRLDSAITISFSSAGAITLTNGTLDLNGYTATLSNASGTFLTAAGTKNLTFNGGSLVVAGTGTIAFNNAAPTNFTTTAGTGTGTISMTGSSAKTFVGGGSTFACALNQGGLGALTITGSNTFNNITNTYASLGTVSIRFTAGTTTTVSAFTAAGQASRPLTLASTTSGTPATVALTGGGTVFLDYLSVQDMSFTPLATDGTAPYKWYAGANSTNLTGRNSGILFAASTAIAYLILSNSGSWTVPADWNNANNAIHMIGGGGGGAGGRASGNNRAAGGGGGGGGYTGLYNTALLTPGDSYSYGVGAGGSGGAAGANGTAGGDTFMIGTAYGGAGGQASTTPSSTGGTGGTGDPAPGFVPFAGGNGGAGAFGTAASTGYGGGGGGGAGGPNGFGRLGGIGFGSTTANTVSGGGGGGNGGGTNGTNGSSGIGGRGGNNFSGTGGATASNGDGTLGGGGGGAATSGFGGMGGSGIDISNTVGGAGGKGGAGAAISGTTSNTGLYGGGGGGGSVSTGGTTRAGASGSQGMIFIIYTPASTGSTSNFFNFFPI